MNPPLVVVPHGSVLTGGPRQQHGGPSRFTVCIAGISSTEVTSRLNSGGSGGRLLPALNSCRSHATAAGSTGGVDDSSSRGCCSHACAATRRGMMKGMGTSTSSCSCGPGTHQQCSDSISLRGFSHHTGNCWNTTTTTTSTTQCPSTTATINHCDDTAISSSSSTTTTAASAASAASPALPACAASAASADPAEPIPSLPLLPPKLLRFAQSQAATSHQQDLHRSICRILQGIVSK